MASADTRLDMALDDLVKLHKPSRGGRGGGRGGSSSRNGPGGVIRRTQFKRGGGKPYSAAPRGQQQSRGGAAAPNLGVSKINVSNLDKKVSQKDLKVRHARWIWFS